MELLHMKISDLLLEPDLFFFLRFPNHDTGWGGGKIHQPGYLHPQPVLLTCNVICYLDQ